MSENHGNVGHAPNVLVVGAGAIGGFYGGKLAQAGARVSVVCRSDYDAVKAAGYQISSVWGDFTFRPERVLRSVDEYDGFPDYVLVTMKVLPTIDVPGLIRPVVGPQTAVVLIQNGIGIEKPVADAFPDNDLIDGLAFIGVSRTGPGHILHQDFGRLIFGDYPTGVGEKTRLLAELFSSAGVSCETTPDVVTARWRKLVWNAPLNPLSVLGGEADTRAMMELPEVVELAEKAMAEVMRIADAEGHPLPDDIIEQNIQGTLAMRPYKTSMLLDYEAGRPMEVEAIVGNAVRIAHARGIPVPLLESLYAMTLLADGKRKQKVFSKS